VIALRVRGGVSHGPTPEQLLQIEGASYFNPRAQEEERSLLFSPSSLDPYNATQDPGVRSEDSWSSNSRTITHLPYTSAQASQPDDKLRLSSEKSVKAFNSGEEDRWTKGKEKEGILGASSSLSATHVTTSRSPSELSVM